jgi:hypothetical protein
MSAFAEAERVKANDPRLTTRRARRNRPIRVMGSDARHSTTSSGEGADSTTS